MSLSWTGITKNKILTDSDINRAAEDGFLTSKITIPTTDKGVTKERALQYININPLHVSYSGKSTNQLITKEDIKKPCDECTSYNIVINQSDLNNISGETDNKIYLYYYPCGTYSGDTPYLTFSYPGTFTDYICAQSCAVTEPFLSSSFDGGTILTDSSYVELAGNCAVSTFRSVSCSGTTVYNVASEGFNYPPTQFDLGQTYGNVDITISISGNTNSNNEIFIGNRAESYGTTYAFGTGAQSISDTIGFISNTTKTTLDVVVYSTTTGNTFTPFNVVFTASCPDGVDCSSATTGTTYYSGTTINVTAIGNIKYDTINGFVFRNITSTGIYTINDCILINTLSPAFPLASVASYNNVVTGSSCNSITVDTSGSETSSTGTTVNCRTITFNANQEYSDTVSWIDCDGFFQSRFVERGTTFTTTALGNFYQIL
jgi:hypothetical protein